MASECPNCRMPLAWYRLFFTPAWGKWRCRHCGALLGIDMRRRLLSLLPVAVFVLLLGLFTSLLNTSLVIAAPVIIIAGVVLLVLYLSRAVLLEPAGFHCRKCGYDLAGQDEGRCPECGTLFDIDLLRQFLSGEKVALVTPGGSRKWAIILLIVILCGLVGAQIAGLIVWHRSNRPAGPVPAPSPTPPAPMSAS